jgi:ANTAR domain-containing protein
MAEDRVAALWGLVAAHAATGGGWVSVVDVCAVAASVTGVSGAWVTATGDGEQEFVLCVTGPVGERLAELQLMLGEGPCHDVLGAAAPVLAADLGDEHSTHRWPGFAVEARRAGAGAVFAFPLTVGAIKAGVLGLYRSASGPLDGGQFGDGLLLADVATVLLLNSAGDGVPGGSGPDGAAPDGPVVDGPGVDVQAPDLALHRAEIDQATGMLTVQLGVSVAEAFARLRAYAYAGDRRLAEVAGDIVARRLRLAPDGGRDRPVPP